MTTPGVNLTKWYPQIPESVPPDVALQLRVLFNGTNDHDQAITTQQTQLDDLTSTVQAVAAAATNTAKTITISQIAGFANLAAVNNQTGVTAYTVQGSDSGSLVAFNDASPIAVTLNSAATIPFFVFLANQGAGAITLSASAGTINGLSVIPGNSSAIAFFDGTNWWTFAILIPQTIAAATHEWLKSYNAATGLFTQTQPAYSDISGTPVLPATIAPVANEFLTGYNATTGTFTQALAAISFNGRTGAVVPATGDYTAAQVANALDLSNTGTQTMLGNLTIASGKVFSANTIKDTTGAVTITLATSGIAMGTFLRANGGITSATYFASGTVPTVAAQAGAGTGATASVSSNSSNGCGLITLNAQATGGAAGAWVTLTFASSPYGVAPRVIIVNGGINVTGAIHYVTSTTSSFTISCTAAPATATYIWYYWVVG